MPLSVIAGLAVIAAAALVVTLVVYRRPQRGVFLLAALTPLDGLLVILPIPSIANGWKEGLVAVTLVCAWMRRTRPEERLRPPLHMPWWPAAAVFVVFGSVSALVAFGFIGVVAIKVTFFYLAVVAILWWAPFDARDRDHLITLVMGMTAFTSFIGLIQLAVGPGVLLSLGYEYGRDVRTAGGLLRVFSTFSQPFPFGLYVMLGLLIGGAVALADPRRRRNALFLALTPFMVIAMASSVVRAAILGLMVGLIWLALRRFRQLGVGLLAGAVGLVAALAVLPASVTGTFFSSSSLGERSAGWSQIVSDILVHPLGQGLGLTGAAADRISTAQGVEFTNLSTNYQPDNYYVKMLLELGPIGLWVFLAMVLTALVWTTRLGETLPGQDGAMALGVSASIVSAMFACLVATYFEIFPIDVYFWLFLGVVGCAAAQHESGSGRLPSDQEEAESRPISVSS
ncbi:hypothetical protein BH10ACT9_BH10ACT9_14780 [soil metagenome]